MSVPPVYVRCGGGRLWHVQKRVGETGCVEMLCCMLATGRVGGKSGQFTRDTTWPQPRCHVCEAKRDGTKVEGLRARVSDLRQWAASRIDECRRQEAKFGRGRAVPRPGTTPRAATGYPPQALVEAWQERQTLEAVLRMLAGEATE